MQKIDLGQTIQIIANVGVIGGLIFVGLQLRQDRDIAIIDSVQSTSSARISWSEAMAASSDVWVRGLADEPLTAAELAIFDALADAHELYYFNNWLRNDSIGTSASRERWIREAALDFVSYPGLMKWWQRHLERLSVTSPGQSPWVTAVSMEIERLNGKSE